MYSGFISTRHAANWLGAHQKFNKAAYRQITPHIMMADFPALDRIQYFEGVNGPDGMKTKTTHRGEEPMHFYNPGSQSDELLGHIDNHYQSLVWALTGNDLTRAAFEAAWLAHSVIDGLTPAHHNQYEQKLDELYRNGGQDFSRRRDKIIIQAPSRMQALKGNWQMWGKNGLLSSHIHFELGVAALVLTSSFSSKMDRRVLTQACNKDPVDIFSERAQEIYKWNMYERFQRRGWTIGLVRSVRWHLAPMIIQTVAMEWVSAAEEAGIRKS